MKALRRSCIPHWLAVSAGSVAVLVLTAGVASAQIDPTATPLENKSPLGPLGPLPSIAEIIAIIAAVVVAVIIWRYMRYAPRFARDEDAKVVRADRVLAGVELPRRSVDLSKAVPVVVAPPSIPVAAPVAVSAAAPAAAAPAAAAPAAAAPVAAAPAAVAPAAAAPAGPRVEVALDQAVFETTLKQLLDAGTDRRIAEGKARRTAMIAAKKAAGEG